MKVQDHIIRIDKLCTDFWNFAELSPLRTGEPKYI